ncbi:MAG: VCBS repeat-containing protein [Pseudomonadota bacterium]
MARAPRLLSRLWRGRARGAVWAVCLWLAATGGMAAADTILSARYVAPTDRYAHGVLGDAIEWAGLEMTVRTADGATVTRTVTLPLDHVFEDVAPRLADLDGDAAPEVIVVEADVTAGAALAVYGPGGKITETTHIGTRNRWLAPLGAADLDGDGVVDLAYVDRPHLAKTLRIWAYEGGRLREVAALAGVTNHRIGETDIAGGIRDCGAGPEMILASANWGQLMALRWDGNGFAREDLGRDTTRPAFARAMACQ